MTGNSSVLYLLKELLEMTTYFPDGGFMVGDTKVMMNGVPSLYSLPVFYNADTDHETRILTDGCRKLDSLSKSLRNDICSDLNFRGLNARISDVEWKKLFEKSFADVLIDLRPKGKKQATNIGQNVDPIDFHQKLKKRIKEKVSMGQSPFQFLFGCHLCNRVLKPIEIGPVRFETRDDWLKRIDGIESTWLDIAFIRSKWQGNDQTINSDEKVAIHTDNLLLSIGDSKYVCSVDIKRPMFYGIGRHVALKAARLALTTIALGHSRPSRALRDMYLNWDEKSAQQILYRFDRHGNGCEFNNQQFPGGIKYVAHENWEKLLEEMAGIFNSVGEIITWFVDGDKDLTNSNTERNRKLFHALLWFYQGCCEEDVHMAIHHLMSSLESHPGKVKNKVKKIQTLMEQAGFNKKSAEEISNLYRNVRSRLAHGNYNWMSQVPSDYRSKAEFAARICLQYNLSQDINLSEEGKSVLKETGN
ncbi:MAG: hypothetical protein OXH90_04385 [Paracoccaceae bacterium]|nr:hypothetical protein [Paracoccaceae bacterium]MDE2917806.1 hypothetical protein [Paracoccaceae bacterium]